MNTTLTYISATTNNSDINTDNAVNNIDRTSNMSCSYY